jgi:hypothetical protein
MFAMVEWSIKVGCWEEVAGGTFCFLLLVDECLPKGLAHVGSPERATNARRGGYCQSQPSIVVDLKGGQLLLSHGGMQHSLTSNVKRQTCNSLALVGAGAGGRGAGGDLAF